MQQPTENTLRTLRADAKAGKLPPLFKPMIPQGDAVAGAAEFATSSTLRQRWGYQGHFDQLKALATEFDQRAQAHL